MVTVVVKVFPLRCKTKLPSLYQNFTKKPKEQIFCSLGFFMDISRDLNYINLNIEKELKKYYLLQASHT